MEINAEAKKRLSTLIEERDAPLAPLAAKIGVSQSTLWNFIYGGTKNFSKLHRLATELKVSLDWILYGDAVAGPSAATRDGTRLAEPGDAGFRHRPGIDNDRAVMREIALAAARLARDYPALPDAAIGAIALTIGAGLKEGRLPMPRGKGVSREIAAEMKRLAVYELGKMD